MKSTGENAGDGILFFCPNYRKKKAIGLRKQTDLAAMKQLARVFLMMDPEPTSFSPVIIKHPFTDSGIVTVRSGNECPSFFESAETAGRSPAWQRRS